MSNAIFNRILWFLCKMIVTIFLIMSQSVGNKFKMSKKNENLALKNQLKIMTSYSIQHERLGFMKIKLCH